MFAKFGEGYLLSKTCDNMESGHESDDNSTLPPLISEEEMDEMSSCDDSGAEPMSMEMLEDICDGNQYHPIVNKR